MKKKRERREGVKERNRERTNIYEHDREEIGRARGGNSAGRTHAGVNERKKKKINIPMKRERRETRESVR